MAKWNARLKTICRFGYLQIFQSKNTILYMLKICKIPVKGQWNHPSPPGKIKRDHFFGLTFLEISLGLSKGPVK